jgi:hypothetical protein
MLLTNFLNDFEKVPVSPVITGITLVFTFHMCSISIYYYYYYYYDIATNILMFQNNKTLYGEPP